MLNNLSVLASTNNHSVSNVEKLQYIVTAYNKIKKPEPWAIWICNSVEKIDKGTLTSLQTLMNDAALKCTKIIASEGYFLASTNTI